VEKAARGYRILEDGHVVFVVEVGLAEGWLVGWSLTSLFSTNISDEGVGRNQYSFLTARNGCTGNVV